MGTFKSYFVYSVKYHIWIFCPIKSRQVTNVQGKLIVLQSLCDGTSGELL